MKTGHNADILVCRQLRITGSVQGVGFRPYVYRIAYQLKIKGQVKNTDQGVQILIQAQPTLLDQFTRLLFQAPPPISVHSIEQTDIPVQKFTDFKISFSENGKTKSAWIQPDLATCPDCLQELNDPGNRRYQYPFINCTHCGPRFSIIESLPYDRPNTTMKKFTMCPACESEYNNPGNRRFHAQPNACSDCGPKLELWDEHGRTIADHQNAIKTAAERIIDGKIAAIKGIGGFQLLVDAGNDNAIKRLRDKKHREAKPFAIMFPNLESVHQYCRISDKEKAVLLSAQAPVVLLFKTSMNPAGLSHLAAPDNPYLGAILPYSPLHHLLMQELDRPVICTSANISQEPICIDNDEALYRLRQIVDIYLVNDRPIARHVDDSVVKTIASDITILRRSRGYAPLPTNVQQSPIHTAAVGGHLKNTISIATGSTIFTSQHIGDLETEAAYQAFSASIQDLCDMYTINPKVIVHDKHPDYFSTHFAHKSGLPLLAVQHHVAHVYSCMAEHNIKPPVLGITWDGTGYGDDGTIWGGEILSIHQNSYDRVGHFLPFALPGGDLAAKEPLRSLAGLLFTLFDGDESAVLKTLPQNHKDEKFSKILLTMLQKNINCIQTSSAGRLFDAISSLLEIQHINHYEGQAAMQLEYKAWEIDDFYAKYPLDITETNGKQILDWRPMIFGILQDKQDKLPVEIIAAKIHNTLAKTIFNIANIFNIKQIVITGGVFQNRYLTDRVHLLLTEKGHDLYMNRLIPPNDGGISAGQILSATYLYKKTEE